RCGRRRSASRRRRGRAPAVRSRLSAAMRAGLRRERVALRETLPRLRAEKRSPRQQPVDLGSWRTSNPPECCRKLSSTTRPTQSLNAALRRGFDSPLSLSAENAGRLADLDQVPVRIADIGADLAPVVLGLGEEFDALG